MRWTIGKKLATLVGIMLLTLGTISFITYSNIDRMISNTGQVTHTFTMINGNSHLITQLFAAEAAQKEACLLFGQLAPLDKELLLR